jgi:hypothetical protein
MLITAQFAAILFLGIQFLTFRSAYRQLEDAVNQRWGLQNVESFVTPEDPAVQATVLAVTYGKTNPTRQDELGMGLKTLYDWVSTNIKVRSDGVYPILPPDPSGRLSYIDDVWQFPNETLRLGSGDCEDATVLLCSMIKYYAPALQVECVTVKAKRGGHMAVQIKASDHTMAILDPGFYYYTRDEVGNVSFKEIYSEAHGWLNLLKPSLGEDVQVFLVFSDNMHIEFNSTKQYVGWMYGFP